MLPTNAPVLAVGVLSPDAFIAKWRRSELKERSAAQGFFIDLCRLLGDSRAVAIAEAARRLVGLRDRWLNPPEWVEWVDEPVPGYRKRPVARDEAAAKNLNSRTLTNLYNARPQWLSDAHADLDAAVAAGYGWDARITEDEALEELLRINSDKCLQ